MPRQVGKVAKGPPGIKQKFNDLIAWCNGFKVTGGKGISVIPTAEGFIINAAEIPQPQASQNDSSTQPPGSGGDMSGGKWVTVDVMDSGCNRSTIQVWAKITS